MNAPRRRPRRIEGGQGALVGLGKPNTFKVRIAISAVIPDLPMVITAERECVSGVTLSAKSRLTSQTVGVGSRCRL